MSDYNSNIEWGPGDDDALLAMWMGDEIAELYCWHKANELGGYPWDEGVRVHPSYTQPVRITDRDKAIVIAVGILLLALSLCSMSTW